MHLDISDYMEYIIYYGIKVEPRDFLFKQINENDFVIDIGANIGETLLNFAKVNSTGHCLGFEPVPYIFEKLKHNIGLNNFKNITIENLAISDIEEDLSFYFPTNNNSGGISLSKSNEKADQIVKAITLDSYVEDKKLDSIDFIKIDVEGFEYNVLKGAKQTIIKYRPKMFIELGNNILLRQGSSSQQVVKFLESYSYQITNVNTQAIVLSTDNFIDSHFDILCVAI